MQNMKMRFQVARHDNAGHDNVGHKNEGHKIATYFGIMFITNIIFYYPPHPQKKQYT